MKKILISLFLLSQLAIFIFPSYAIPIYNCVTLSSNGYFSLGNNISLSSSPCIYIKNVNFLIFDCKNKYLSSKKDKTAIMIYNSSNIQFLNCHFINNSLDMNITKSENVSISNSFSYNSNSYIHLKDTKNIILENSILKDIEGIKADNTSNLTIKSLTVNATETSLNITSSTKINLSYSNLYGSKYGVFLNDTNNFIFSHNNISYNQKGIIIKNSDNGDIYDNLFINSNNINISNSSNLNFNTTLNCNPYTKSITNSPCIGGNFWGNISESDFSDTCNDQGNGICDNKYTFDGFTDYLPLSPYIYINLSSPKYFEYNMNKENIWNIQGIANIMPYHKSYNGNISIYLSSYGFIKNITIFSGILNATIIHPINSYDKKLILVGYSASGGKSNNTFYLKVPIYYMGINTKDGLYYADHSIPYTILYADKLYILLLSSKKGQGKILGNDLEFYVNPTYSSIVVGFLPITPNLDLIQERIDKYYKGDFCSFSFSHTINNVCNVILPIFSPYPINSPFKVFGEGEYNFIIKKGNNQIYLGIG